MKTWHAFVSCICVAAAALVYDAGAAAAEDTSTDQLSVLFSDPSRPGKLQVGILNGGITISGYDGKEVAVKARVRGEDEETAGRKGWKVGGHRPKQEDKAAGLRRIPMTATGLAIEENDNVMSVEVDAHSHAVDLAIQVPRQTSLELSCVNDGDIHVEGVQGEIEVSNTNGAVKLTDVSGSVVAHALNDNVVVRFVKVDPVKPMSFSSLNGDIDVTLPPDVHANVRLKTFNGDVLSDFDIRMQPEQKRVEEGKEDGKYRVRIEKAMIGTLNGGGPELRFETFNGSIYIRKGK